MISVISSPPNIALICKMFKCSRAVEVIAAAGRFDPEPHTMTHSSIEGDGGPVKDLYISLKLRSNVKVRMILRMCYHKSVNYDYSDGGSLLRRGGLLKPELSIGRFLSTKGWSQRLQTTVFQKL